MTHVGMIKALINGRCVTVRGRAAWALAALLAAGDRGCTPVSHPAPRWSDYVHKMRRLGFSIDTAREYHGGPYPGRHARYVLHGEVRVIKTIEVTA